MDPMLNSLKKRPKIYSTPQSAKFIEKDFHCGEFIVQKRKEIYSGKTPKRKQPWGRAYGFTDINFKKFERILKTKKHKFGGMGNPHMRLCLTAMIQKATFSCGKFEQARFPNKISKFLSKNFFF